MNKIKINARNDTPLYMAAQSGHDSLVKSLIELGADVNVGNFLNPEAPTPLHAACERQNLEVVRILVENGANLEAHYPQTSATPLYIACHLMNVDVAEYLLQKGADPDARDFASGDTCLHVACRLGNVAIVQLLLQFGVNPEQKSYEGLFAVERAFSNRNVDVLEFIFQQDVYKITKALVIACNRRDLWGITWILNHGADVEGGKEIGDTTVLALAAKNGYWEVIAILLEYGANVNVVDDCGFSPLWHMCMAGYAEIAQIMISKGADVNARKNDRYMTPLQLISGMRSSNSLESLNYNLAKTMIEEGADINAIYYKMEKGMIESVTALHIALNAKFSKMVKLFAENNAQYLPKITTIDNDKESEKERIIMDIKTVWDLAGEDKNLLSPLSLPWSPATHTRQHPRIREACKCFLLINRRLLHFDSHTIQIILEYAVHDWPL